MTWKKTLLYFAFQSVRHSKSVKHFSQIWSYYGRWKDCLKPERNSMADELAWINFSASDFLDQHLTKEHRVFEFGGGGSTLFFCKRAGFVCTVENHTEWFDLLNKKIREKGLQNWEGYLEEGEPFTDDKPRSPSNPADFSSNSGGLQRTNFEKYAKTIHKYPNSHFDVVLVDGRARPSCARESLPHIKPGGLLVLDNMERDYYWTMNNEMFDTEFDVVQSAYYPLPYHPDFVLTVVLRKK